MGGSSTARRAGCSTRRRRMSSRSAKSSFATSAAKSPPTATRSSNCRASGGGDVAPLFHVVETTHEQVAGGLVDVEQRVARDDFAPGAQRVAADRIDRGFGQP